MSTWLWIENILLWFSGPEIKWIDALERTKLNAWAITHNEIQMLENQNWNANNHWLAKV